MRTWAFYKTDTGEFVGRSFSAHDDTHLKENTPAECSAVEGHYDHGNVRFCLQTFKVIPKQ